MLSSKGWPTLKLLRIPGWALLIPTIVGLAIVFRSEAKAQTKSYPLSLLQGLKLLNVEAEPVTYEGRKAIRVVEPRGQKGQATEDRLVIPERRD